MRTTVLVALLACAARAEEFVVRVTAANEPVHNAAVRVLKADGEIVFDRTNWPVDTLTDESGQAVVNVPEGGRVLVYTPGYALAVVEADRIPLDVELKPERVYEGRVVDSLGKPVAGADVWLNTTFKRRATFEATTDKEGRFFVYGLWLDDYSVGVAAPGYLHAHQESAKGQDLVLRRVASIAGAFVDVEGKPVGGLELDSTLTLVNEDSENRYMDPYLDTEMTKDGRFTVKDLEPGRYRFYPAGPWGGSTDVDLKEGEHRKGVRIVVSKPATLRMRFVDGKGKPVPSVGLQFKKERCGKDGRFEVRVQPNIRAKLRLARKHDFERTLDYGPEPPGSKRDLGDVTLKTIGPANVVVRLPDGKLAQQGLVDKVPLNNGHATLPEPGVCFVNIPGFPEVRFDAPGELTLPELRWLDGTVLDGEAKPVEGAQVTASDRSPYPTAEAVTDAKGAFRVGPLAGPAVSVSVAKAGKQTVSKEIVLSDGRLLVELASAASVRLVRGSVTRDGRPVQDFHVHGQRFLNEAGRFEVLVNPAESKWLSYRVGKMRYFIPMPVHAEAPIGIKVPTGRISVELGGVTKRTFVQLRPARRLSYPGHAIATLDTKQAGLLHFEGIEPGVYSVHAEGYETVDAKPGDTVRLEKATGRLRILSPPGTYFPNPPPREVAAGVRSIEAQRALIWISARVEVVRGEETVLDLVGETEVVIRAKGDGAWRLESDNVTYSGNLSDGVVRIRNVPAGGYRLSAGIQRRTVVVEGATVEFDFEPGTLTLEGVVSLDGGRAAQGASIQLLVEGDERSDHEWQVFTNLAGRFEFKRLAPGTYRCVAMLDSYAPAVTTVEVGETGAAGAVRMVLKRAAGVRVRVVGLLGKPLRGVFATVNGIHQVTDELGHLTLDAVPATVRIDHEGYASIRGIRITGPGTIKLTRGADLVILLDPEAGELEVSIDGQVWELPESIGDRLVLRDLPPGPLQITQTPEEREDEESEPQIVQTKLNPGETVTVDLRD